MGLRKALDLAEGALAESDATASAAIFGLRLQAEGVSYFQARRYRRPPGRLTSRSHWQAGGMLHRVDEKHWLGRASSNYICFAHNPLLEPVAQSVSRFRFSDYAPFGEAGFGDYWDAMEEGGIGEGLGALAFGRTGMIANLHIGFSDRTIAREDIAPIADAATLVAAWLLDCGTDTPSEGPPLTRRERDVMAYMMDGKTDWEVGKILAISETTARFHADNARRKLGAVNRPQAVARYVATYGLI
jgi:DNA-binding CsgD family transcriptional regulator